MRKWWMLRFGRLLTRFVWDRYVLLTSIYSLARSLTLTSSSLFLFALNPFADEVHKQSATHTAQTHAFFDQLQQDPPLMRRARTQDDDIVREEPSLDWMIKPAKPESKYTAAPSVPAFCDPYDRRIFPARPSPPSRILMPNDSPASPADYASLEGLVEQAEESSYCASYHCECE